MHIHPIRPKKTQSASRPVTRPDRVPLLPLSVSGSGCSPSRLAPSKFHPAPQTPPAVRSAKFPHSKSCPPLSPSARASPAGHHSLAPQAAWRSLTLDQTHIIRQTAHTPAHRVRRTPISGPAPCFQSPVLRLWFSCRRQTGSPARSDPKKKKKYPRTTPDSHHSNFPEEFSSPAGRAATRRRSVSSARRDISSTPPATSNSAHTLGATRPANTNQSPRATLAALPAHPPRQPPYTAGQNPRTPREPNKKVPFCRLASNRPPRPGPDAKSAASARRRPPPSHRRRRFRHTLR